jgi:hypothetical protein
MDQSEAIKILSGHLAQFTKRHYADLAKLVQSSHVEYYKTHGASGATYQLEIQLFWDEGARGRILVIGSIDDGGIRAFIPLTQTVLVSRPDG